MSNIKYPGDNDVVTYFTQRSIYVRGDKRKDNWEETGHKVKVWVFKDDLLTANVEYSCPYCGHKEACQKPYSEPFEFDCDGCGKKIKVPKLDKRLSKKAKKKA